MNNPAEQAYHAALHAMRAYLADLQSRQPTDEDRRRAEELAVLGQRAYGYARSPSSTMDPIASVCLAPTLRGLR